MSKIPEQKIITGMIDSHFHSLEMTSKDMETELLLKRCFIEGTKYILDAATSENDFEIRLKTASNFPGMFLAAGIHPSEAPKGNLEIEAIQSQLASDKVVALGEIGLDLYHTKDNLQEQLNLFDRQMEIAKVNQFPVIIHDRLADEYVLERLTYHKNPKGGVIHCFSSNYDFACKCIDLGYYISFAGNVTYKKSEDIQNTAKRIPLNRILTETDAPFLAPQKVRGNWNAPNFMGWTVEYICKLRDIEIDSFISQVESNFVTLFLT